MKYENNNLTCYCSDEKGISSTPHVIQSKAKNLFL